MSEADQLFEELKTASRSLRKCDCGSAVFMQYQPGVTQVICLKEREAKDGVPDWDPKGMAEQWNNR